jgi:hypothetical protein
MHIEMYYEHKQEYHKTTYKNWAKSHNNNQNQKSTSITHLQAFNILSPIIACFNYSELGTQQQQLSKPITQEPSKAINELQPIPRQR